MTPISPLIAPAAALKDKSRLQLLINLMHGIMFVSCLILFLIVLFFGKNILQYFGTVF